MKSANFILYSLFILLIILFLRFYKQDIDYRRAHPSTSEYALKPDMYIDNAKKDLKRHYYKTSEKDIAKAIKAMRLIEVDYDSISINAIETAIGDLADLEKEIQQNVHDKIRVNQVFSKALNSLAYAQMRLSEQLVEENKKEEAIYALQYAIRHLQNAMEYSTESEQEIERQIYSTIDSLVRYTAIDKAFFRNKINSLLVEMDSTILP